MAAALKRCYDKQTHFRQKISVEEQRAQKDNRFLRGRQITFLIYEYFRPAGSYDEVQGLSRSFSIKLENDTSQDAPDTKFKFGEEKGHQEEKSKKVNRKSEILARLSLRKEHLRKPHDKKSTPAKQHGIWREFF